MDVRVFLLKFERIYYNVRTKCEGIFRHYFVFSSTRRSIIGEQLLFYTTTAARIQYYFYYYFTHTRIILLPCRPRGKCVL